jgi:hypothetical protein
MKLTPFFLLLFISCCYGQVEFKVIHAGTKQPLSNIPVRFGEKNGIYSNAQGAVSIPKEFDVKEIRIDTLGFEPFNALAVKVQGTIIPLKPVAYNLPEVVLRGNPKKIKTVKQRATRSNSWINGVKHLHGEEFGIYIPKEDPNSEVQLMEITVPIINKTMDRIRFNKDMKKAKDDEGVPAYGQRNSFRFLYHINFYHKINDSVMERIGIAPKELIVRDEQRRYEIDLRDDQLFANQNGIMIGLHNLGPCDEKGILLPIPRYSRVEKTLPDGTKYRPINNIDNVPSLGMTKRRKDNSVNYKHYHISERSRWNKIADWDLGGTVGGNSNQLSLGYKLEVTTY